jgi:hypothetical protein
MKRTVKFLPLLLVMFTAASCKLVYAKPSKEDIDYSGASSKPSPNTAGARSSSGVFVPIDKSWEFVDDIADPVPSSGGQAVDYQAAKDIIDNDYLPSLASDPLSKLTKTITLVDELDAPQKFRVGSASAMTEHHERQDITMIHSDLLWEYTRVVDNRITYYFDSPNAMADHAVYENLRYYEDGYIYNVHTKLFYQEGNEDYGTASSYFNKTRVTSEDAVRSQFAINSMDYVYFNATQGLDMVKSRIDDNLFSSSDYYRPVSTLFDRTTSNIHYTRGTDNALMVQSDDSLTYGKDDLTNGGEHTLDHVDYHQDFMVVTPNCHDFTELYETTVTSKTSSNETIREERKHGRTTLIDACDVFYPDLSKYPERDDPDNPIYW